ncbi:MAG TPA: hypothetical protein VKT75_13800 [Acidobacteriaceae bacterium]|nr:hypothetical protein [Acidobacteriaceae bacterium]
MQLRLTSTSTCGLMMAALLCLPLVPTLRAEQPAPQPAPAVAQDAHVVSPLQLQQQVQSASALRQKNIENLTQFLSSPAAVHALKSHQIDPAKVTSAIPNLSDAELADLSARATHAQQAFAAGTLDNNTLLIIILVLVAVILIAVLH